MAVEKVSDPIRRDAIHRVLRAWVEQKSLASYGQHPLVFMPSYTKFPYGRSELEIAGGLIGKPLAVLRGPITGLPIPASSEIAIEGEIPPPSEEARSEGPFGEWPGYYSGGTGGTGENQPIIRVKAIYHRMTRSSRMKRRFGQAR